MTLFPVMRLFNTFLEKPVRSPVELSQVWGRWRNGANQSPSLSAKLVIAKATLAAYTGIPNTPDLATLLAERYYDKEDYYASLDLLEDFDPPEWDDTCQKNDCLKQRAC